MYINDAAYLTIPIDLMAIGILLIIVMMIVNIYNQ